MGITVTIIVLVLGGVYVGAGIGLSYMEKKYKKAAREGSLRFGKETYHISHVTNSDDKVVAQREPEYPDRHGGELH